MTDIDDVNIVERDLPEFVSLLTSLSTNIQDSSAHLNDLQGKVVEARQNDGLSYLEMKCHMFLEYLINLTHVMVLKLNGDSLIDQGCIKRLVRTRTILEKIKPLDKKLSYQIDKLIKMSSYDVNKTETHPLSFKPNLDDLVTKEESDDPDDDVDSSAQVYVPPKVTAVLYEEENQQSKREKKVRQSKQKSLNKSLLDELRREYSEAPEEIHNRKNNKRAKIREIEDEREQFEEANLRRLTLTKKDKIKQTQLNEIDEIINLGAYQGVGDDSDNTDTEEKYKPKKKKGKFAQKKFKKRMQKRKK